jgi:hypothetical protein
MHVDGVGRVADEQRMSIGRRAHDHFPTERPGRARTIVDDELLAQALGELLARMRATASDEPPGA